MNILIKLTCLIGLVIAPILGSGVHTDSGSANAMASCCAMPEKCATMSKEECAKMGCNENMTCTSMSKEECMEKGCKSTTCKFMNATESTKKITSEIAIEKVNVDGKVTATIKTTGANGTSNTRTFEGTEAEVSAQIEAFKKN